MSFLLAVHPGAQPAEVGFLQYVRENVEEFPSSQVSPQLRC